MATSVQVGRATAVERKPVGAEYMAADHLLSMPAQDRMRAALERDLARWMGRRLANRHGCPGRCARPEHAVDVAAGVEVLQALGLTIYEHEQEIT